MNKLMSKLTRSGSSRSMRSSSFRMSTGMQVDIPRARVPPSSPSPNILLEEKHLKLWNKKEKDAFKNLKTRRFVHTSAYDPALLQAIG